MRFVLKLIAAPLALALTVLTAFFSFVLSMSEVFLSLASVLVFVAAAALLFSGERAGAAAFLSIAFLVSPFGLPRLAGWLIERLEDANSALKGFIFG
ncbi:MAG: CD1845 family protein [Gracilibacteraceae bacterium]|jgi:biotin transporter BioY|nr:CD1845 family protein [Gracilibacteraceae bacterium]